MGTCEGEEKHVILKISGNNVSGLAGGSAYE